MCTCCMHTYSKLVSRLRNNGLWVDCVAQEEQMRLGSAEVPLPPPSPPRHPRPLCPSVDAVRQQFRVRCWQ
jgi:hypothetical protein